MIPKRNENFCRVFELPISYPSGFCFGGGKPVTFKMVDWFEPWPADNFKLVDKTWPEVTEMLKDFLSEKEYVKFGYKYVIITDFGESFVFTKTK